jgi:hypothetical protein
MAKPAPSGLYEPVNEEREPQMSEQSSPDPLKSAATDLLAAITKLVSSGASAIESMAGEAVKGSGNVIQKSFDLAGFSRVDLGSAFIGEIKQSDGWSVVVSADDNIMERISVTVEEQTLRVRTTGFLVKASRLHVDVGMPTIEALAVGGASQATIGGFARVPAFALLLSGASQVKGEISADALTVQPSGASKTTLRGSGGTLSVNASGASHVSLAELPVESATVNLSGASHATINVSRTIDASASGASHLVYLGDATLASSKMSGGSGLKHQ